jgi:hypothetical protein
MKWAKEETDRRSKKDSVKKDGGELPEPKGEGDSK